MRRNGDGISYLVPIDGNTERSHRCCRSSGFMTSWRNAGLSRRFWSSMCSAFRRAEASNCAGTGEGDEGTMPEDFDKDLLNPPAGVQVWSSCMKDQCSVELDRWQRVHAGPVRFIARGRQDGGDRGAPTQPIPVETLAVEINQKLKILLTPEKRAQAARLTGAVGNAVRYDGKEPLASVIAFKPPTVAGGNTANAAQVNSILDELRILPAVRDTRIGDAESSACPEPTRLPRRSNSTATRPTAIKTSPSWRNALRPTMRLMRRNSRCGPPYFEAPVALQESQKEVQMRETLQGPMIRKQKTAFLRGTESPANRSSGSRRPWTVLPTPRKNATWKPTNAGRPTSTTCRPACKCALSICRNTIHARPNPQRQPTRTGTGQNGWRIGISGAKLNVTENDAKDLAKKTKKLWDKIEESYPDTPWSLLAQRESKISLGLIWKAKSD